MIRRASRRLLFASTCWLAAAVFAADPVASTPELQAAVVEYRARRDAEAQAALEKILVADPASDVAYFYLGKLAKRRNDFKEAIACWRKCTELKPEFAEYWGVLAEAYGRRAKQNILFAPGCLKPGRAALEKAIELDPNDLRFRLGYIKMLMDLPGILGGSVEKAREQAEEVRKRDAGAGWLVLGRIEIEERNWAEAEKSLIEAAKADPTSVEPAIELARVLIERGRADEALKRFDELLAQNPKHPGAQIYFAKATLACDRELERGEAAVCAFLEPRSPPLQLPSFAEARAMLGEFRARRGDKDAAREAYEAALKLEPEQKLAVAGLKRLKAK